MTNNIYDSRKEVLDSIIDILTNFCNELQNYYIINKEKLKYILAYRQAQPDFMKTDINNFLDHQIQSEELLKQMLSIKQAIEEALTQDSSSELFNDSIAEQYLQVLDSLKISIEDNKKQREIYNKKMIEICNNVESKCNRKVAA